MTVKNTQFRLESVTPLPGLDGLNQNCSFVNGHFAYFGTATTPVIIGKVDLNSQMVIKTATTTLSNGNGFVNAFTNGKSGYFESSSVPDTFIQVSLADLTTLATLATGDSDIGIGSFLDNLGNAYVVGDDPSLVTGYVKQINLQTFTTSKRVSLPEATYNGAFDPVNNVGYFGTSNFTNNGTIYKFSVPDATILATISIPGAYDVPIVVIDLPNRILYAITNVGTLQLLKIDLNSFTVVKTLNFGSADDVVFGIAIDSNQNIYFLTDNFSTNFRIYRIHLSNFSASFLSLPVETDNVVGILGNYLYLTSFSPANLLKINIGPIDNVLEPQLTFQVDLTPTLVPQAWDQPFNPDFTFNNSTFLPTPNGNIEARHGATICASGLTALYLQNTYTTGPNPILKLVTSGNQCDFVLAGGQGKQVLD